MTAPAREKFSPQATPEVLRAPLEIYADMIRMFESDNFDFAHLEPWLRGMIRPLR